MLGHIPEAGEQYVYGPLTVTVQLVEEQRVLSLLVEKQPPAPEESEPEETKKKV